MCMKLRVVPCQPNTDSKHKPCFAWTGTHFASVRQRDIDEETFVRFLMSGSDNELQSSVTIAKFVAGRVNKNALPESIPMPSFIAPNLRQITPPDGLPDIDKSAKRLSKAICHGETIGIVTDHDVDGVSSHAVILSALAMFGFSNTKSYIGNRLKHGYGLSTPVAERVLDDMPEVIITADCGSSDEPRISKLNDAGIDVIVTDHHEIPSSGIPQSAFAVVSPIREDSIYTDKSIAGCMVAWLLMCAVRRQLIASGHLEEDTPSLACLLDFVGLGTVADCVSLGNSVNNRAIVRHAIELVARQQRPCWTVARELGWLSDEVSSLDFAFQIGPRINARGRLNDAMYGVHFLMAKNASEAYQYAEALDTENKERKMIEAELVEAAVTEAECLIFNKIIGLAVWLPNGHPGVHGIVASRLVERFGAPVLCLSPHAVESDIITGSARTVNGINIKAAFDYIANKMGERILKFGGHKGAGGISITASALDELRREFDNAIKTQISTIPGPKLITDGKANISEVESIIRSLSKLEPFGRGFELPSFEFYGYITNLKALGKEGKHISFTLNNNNESIRCVWFGARLGVLPLRFANGCHVTVIGEPSQNTFRGNTTMQLIVRGVML